MNENKLLVINIDLIKELRFNGQHVKASNLLNAYYKDKKKNKKQVYNNCLKRDRLIKKSKYVCRTEHCFNPIFKSGLCKEHYNLKLRYINKSKNMVINGHIRLSYRPLIKINKEYVQLNILYDIKNNEIIEDITF